MRALGIGAALLAGGCGLGIVDNTSGGGDNLPTLGAGPYGRLELDFATPADEPSEGSAQAARERATLAANDPRRLLPEQHHRDAEHVAAGCQVRPRRA